MYTLLLVGNYLYTRLRIQNWKTNVNCWICYLSGIDPLLLHHHSKWPKLCLCTPLNKHPSHPPSFSKMVSETAKDALDHSRLTLIRSNKFITYSFDKMLSLVKKWSLVSTELLLKLKDQLCVLTQVFSFRQHTNPILQKNNNKQTKQNNRKGKISYQKKISGSILRKFTELNFFPLKTCRL